MVFAARRSNGPLSDPVDRFFQEIADFVDAFHRSVRKDLCLNFPAAPLLPSLPAELGQFLWVRVKEAQTCLHCRGLACVSSLRPSLASRSDALFCAFLGLRLIGIPVCCLEMRGSPPRIVPLTAS